jgi:ATP-binding cassette subfamily B protein
MAHNKLMAKEKMRGRVAGPATVARFYGAEIRRHAGLFSLVVIGTIGMQLASLVSPLFLRQFFNILSSETPNAAIVHQLLVVIGWIALVSFLGWAANRIQSLSIMYLEMRAMSALYLAAFDYLIGHSYQFFVSQFAGTLTRRVSKYASSFEVLFDSVMGTFFPTMLYVAGAIGVLYVRNAALGIALGVWTAAFVSFQVFVSRMRQPIRMARAEEDSALTGTIADAIGNQNTITLFSGGAYEHGVTWRAVERWRKATRRAWITDDYIWGAQGLLMVGINVGLLYGALHFWQEGLLTVGDFVLIQSYLVGIFTSLGGLTREMRRVYDALADAGEMASILETPHGVRDIPQAPDLKVAEGKIEFKHVDFFFHETRPILRNLDLAIPGGQKVALVGSSGAGKTTMTRLLLRFYDVSGGAILIDGQDISRVSQESLRDALAFVPQEPILFHRSLTENIRYGRRDASDEAVIEAARKAHCHEFITGLPEGYGTYVGERGVRLSGGERQRIAIARAILKNALILILDEATSSLDSESESLIQESLSTLMQGKTVLVIAHRLSTIMRMDRIIVLDQGAIVADGTHQELLSQAGLYQKLWNIQAGGFLQDEEQS